MVGFNPFGSVTGKTSATLFEIRLDSDIIVLRGDENDSSSQLLKGNVVLCLPSSLKVEDVHLRMTGQLRAGWNDLRTVPSGVSNNKTEKITEIFNHKWAPFVGGHGPGSSSKGTLLPAGNYEWPFELVIPGSMAESIEGLQYSHIIYKLKATVARGKLAYDLHAHKPVRIVRTLDPSALELAHAMTVENIWPNKIEYQIIIPQKAIIFGTAIDVEMRFTSLLKGLKIGNIRMELVETQEITIPGLTPHSEKYHKHSRCVDTWNFELNDEEHYHDILDENGADGWAVKEKMPLPKRLSKCLQDVDVHGIKIRHKVKFNIALLNPDGHTSELRATLPVTIFISPNMPLNQDGELVDQTPTSAQISNNVQHAPPLYGEHVLDQLYADVDQSGFMTPAPQSGMNTPFNALSRAGSHENLASMAAGQNSPHPAGAVPPAALSSRLQNLDSHSRNSSFLRRIPGGNSGGNTPHSHPNDIESYFSTNANGHSGSVSGHASASMSRRVSNEEEDDSQNRASNLTSGVHTPEHLDYSELGDLNKVPSYSTAVKSPIRGVSYSEVLPNYDTAVSAPPSPNRRFSSMSSMSTPAVEHPPELSTSFGSSSHGSNVGARNPFSNMGFTPIHPPPMAFTNDAGERARLISLRSRDGH